MLLAGCSEVSQEEYNSVVSLSSQAESEKKALEEKYNVVSQKYDDLKSEYDSLNENYEILSSDCETIKSVFAGFAKAAIFPDSQLTDSYIEEESNDNVGYLDSKLYDNAHYYSYSKLSSDLSESDIAYVIYRNAKTFKETVSKMGKGATIVRAYYDSSNEFIMFSYVYIDEKGEAHDFAIWTNESIKYVHDQMKTNNGFENYKLPQKTPNAGAESVAEIVPATSTTTVPETSNPSETLPTVTMGERNALNKAKEYLNVIPFSYSGLIEQLEYNGFSKEEARDFRE